MEKKPNRKLTKAGKIILDILMIACLCIAGYAGWNIYTELQDQNNSKNAYSEIADTAKKKDTGTDSTVDDTLDFNALAEINPDIQAWIELPDSNIDYPVVQTTDNEYYLTHLFTKEYSKHGCIFIDANNTPGFADKNTVLYGHHMKDGTMFADIENYSEAGYYETHKEINITTAEGKWIMYPIAGVLKSGSDDYVRYTFTDDDSFMSYVNEFVNSSDFKGEQSVTANDQVMLLSTCSYDIEDGRYVLLGKLVRVE